nr:hypothetical protein [Nocardia thailandica]
MLEEPQGSARLEDPGDLGQGGALVGHRAQHQAHHDCVERCILGVDPVSDAVDDLDGDRRGRRELFGPATQQWFRFQRHQLGHCRRIELEVRARTDPDLEDVAGQPLGEAAAELAYAGPFQPGPGQAQTEPGEEWSLLRWHSCPPPCCSARPRLHSQ